MTPEKIQAKDEPLPLTLLFVSIFGIALTIGWLLMFVLLRQRL